LNNPAFMKREAFEPTIDDRQRKMFINAI